MNVRYTGLIVRAYLFKAILYGSSNVSCRHLELMRVKNNGAFFHGLCYLAVENYLFKHS